MGVNAQLQSAKSTSTQPIINLGGLGGRRRGPRGMPVEKARDLRGTVRRLWTYFRGQRRLLLLLFGLILFSTLIGLFVPYLVGKAIDALGEQTGVNFDLLQIIVTTLLVAYILDGVLVFLQGWFVAGLSQQTVLELRNATFAKLQKLPTAYFDRHTHGEIMSRLANDIDNVSTTIAQSTTQLIDSVFMISGSFVMMLILSPLLTLASMITIPMVFGLTRTIAKRTKLFFKEQQQNLGILNGHIEEMITGIEIVKAFNYEEQVIDDFAKINQQLCQVGIKAQTWSGFIMPLMNVINNIGFTAVAAVGGVLAVHNLITVGIIASFLSYSRQFVRPLNEVANLFNTLQSAIASAERVFEIMDQPEEAADLENAIDLDEPEGRVEFVNVTFGYEPGVDVCKNMSFTIEPGTRVAIVGPTGAGKTTIINLLTRFYDVDQGQILIDGKDIREYHRASLRKVFGIVLQDTYLFSGTIEDNLRYGRIDASKEEIREAARLANADHFICRLPLGYQTPLTESGSNLSQGQRQLLAIARAILANPKILILDEATSNVDTRTELQIQEAMVELMEGKTSFVIAHRLSTIRDADVIMVVDQGQIVEVGNHQQLLAQQGVYYRLYDNQFKNLAI